MRIKKRKILLGIVCTLLGVAFVLVLMNLISLHNTTDRVRTFNSRHAGAPAQAARTVARFYEATRPDTGGAAASVRPTRQPVATMTTASLSGKLKAIDQEYNRLHQAFVENWDWSLTNAQRGGIGGAMLYLPAGDFPEEGASGPLRGGATLRERIRKEVRERGKIFAVPEERRLAHQTTPTLARQAAALIDRAGRLVDFDWSTTVTTPLAYSAFYQFAPLAAERKARQGRLDEAGDLLVRLVRLELLARFKQFPVRVPLWNVQRMALHMAEEKLIDDAGLARVDRVLAEARLSEAQLADLRSAAAVRIIQEFEDLIKNMGNDRRSGEYQRILDEFSRQGTRVILKPLYQALLAWAAGDGAAYDKALRNPLSMMFILPMIQDGRGCPSHLASFGGESAANDELDLTRLVVAAARYRLARGRYPGGIEELVPQYLNPAASAGGMALRAVEWLSNADLGPDGKGVQGRPIFFLARRMTLTPIRLAALWGYGDRFQVVDQTGLRKSSAGADLIGLLDSRSGQMINLMSSRSVETIVVWVVWPKTEEVDWGWLDGVGNSGAQQTIAIDNP